MAVVLLAIMKTFIGSIEQYPPLLSCSWTWKRTFFAKNNVAAYRIFPAPDLCYNRTFLHVWCVSRVAIKQATITRLLLSCVCLSKCFRLRVATKLQFQLSHMYTLYTGVYGNDRKVHISSPAGLLLLPKQVDIFTKHLAYEVHFRFFSSCFFLLTSASSHPLTRQGNKHFISRIGFHFEKSK